MDVISPGSNAASREASTGYSVQGSDLALGQLESSHGGTAATT